MIAQTCDDPSLPNFDPMAANHSPKVATNATIFVSIESEGLIVILSSGQRPKRYRRRLALHDTWRVNERL